MTTPTYEVRSAAGEVRMVEEGGKRLIRGYAAVFNTPSQVLSDPKGRQFREMIKPGAFRRSLLDADVRALFNHKTEHLLGRRSTGTLRLIEDEIGLRYEIDPPDTTTGRDVKILLERGDISGSSFSFSTIADDWSKGDDGMDVRELKEAHLFDVGPVVFPAYLEASAAYRSLDERSDVQTPAVIYPTPEQVLALNRLKLALLS